MGTRMSVELHFNGQRAQVSPGQSLFQVAESLGIKVPTSCRKQGKCKECLVEIADGMDCLSPRLPAEKHLKGSFRLSCCSNIVAESGMTVDGWVPVDPQTLETRFPGVYAVGDVTSIGTPKAGVFSEGQASIVAAQLIARHRGVPAGPSYDGRGICYLEFGHDLVGKVDVTFLSGQAPVGDLDGPSEANAAEKADFGSSRIRRWFDRDWSPAGG